MDKRRLGERLIAQRAGRWISLVALLAVLLLAPTLEAEASGSVHTVRPGESLWLIAQRYDTTVATLQRANGLSSSRIYPGQQLRVAAAPVGVSSEDVRWLAQLVWAEAEGEPYRGQVAVAAVVLNRVENPHFPNSIRGVIFQRGQFETVANGRIYRPAPAIAYRAAQDALNGWDPSYNAIYFFNPAKTRNPFLWSRPVTVVIGQHRFTR
ncbi:MAG TPA: cell wall hydrolase [Bacillota bacterium]